MELKDLRLKTIADMIRRGDRVADIGTDHAYLAIYLKKSSIASKVIASDIVDGPLENARKSIEAAGFTEKEIALRKSDGLENYSADEIDTVVIAGMGGDVIAKIISAAEWLKNEKIELILQPMTSAEDLRKFLSSEGYSVTLEKATESAGRIYSVIKAVYSGHEGPLDSLFLLTGKLDPMSDPLAVRYIKRVRRIAGDKADSIKSVDRKREEYENLKAALEKIDRMLETYGT